MSETPTPLQRDFWGTTPANLGPTVDSCPTVRLENPAGHGQPDYEETEGRWTPTVAKTPRTIQVDSGEDTGVDGYFAKPSESSLFFVFLVLASCLSAVSLGVPEKPS